MDTVYASFHKQDQLINFKYKTDIDNTLSVNKLGVGIDEPLARLHIKNERSTAGDYPPAHMTGNVTTFANLEYGNGTYTSSASSTTATYPAWKAFEGTSDAWRSAAGMYNTSTGVYLGTVQYAAKTGEWISLQFPTPIKPTEVEITFSGVFAQHYAIYGKRTIEGGFVETLLFDTLTANPVPFPTNIPIVTEEYWDSLTVVFTRMFPSNAGYVAINKFNVLGSTKELLDYLKVDVDKIVVPNSVVKVGVGLSNPTAQLHLTQDALINNVYHDEEGIDLGYGRIGREENAGKIGYGRFTPNTVDIIGAGETVGDRRIKLWDTVNITSNLDVKEKITSSNLQVINSTTLSNVYANGNVFLESAYVGALSFNSLITTATGTASLRYLDLKNRAFLKYGEAVKDVRARLVTNLGNPSEEIVGDPTGTPSTVDWTGHPSREDYSLVIPFGVNGLLYNPANNTEVIGNWYNLGDLTINGTRSMQLKYLENKTRLNFGHFQWWDEVIIDDIVGAVLEITMDCDDSAVLYVNGAPVMWNKNNTRRKTLVPIQRYMDFQVLLYNRNFTEDYLFQVSSVTTEFDFNVSYKILTSW